MKLVALLLAPVGVLLSFGCRDGAAIEHSVPSALHADSSRTPEEHMHRFTADLSERPTALSGGAASPEQLVSQFMRAVQQKGTVALMRTHLSRAEFAYLYYPTHPQAQAPYSLPPDLMWMMLEAQSVKGVSQAVSKLGQNPPRLEAVHCQRVSSHGDNRVHSGCLGALRQGNVAGDPATLPLGPIIERNGQFKFVSFGTGE